jgi:choline dehydrogenase-like flavoprotein
MTRSYDVVIIGTGMGGGTLARALKDSELKILLLERGTHLPVEPQNQDAAALFIENRYKAKEHWIDARTGLPFKPGVHYWVGGNTKVFGAAFPRLRPQDFDDLEHEGGTAPAWPISYDDLEPYYAIVERWYWVHGEAGVDPTEGPRSTPFPHPPVPADPYMADLAARMRSNGLHPFSLPIGIDLQTGGKCIRCGTCDPFPCMYDAKGDADICGVRPALESGNVELQTNTLVRRLITDKRGKKVTGVETVRDGVFETITVGTVVVACGAVNSAALLLRSANDAHPSGLANSSDQVGRNYMVHNNAVLIAIDPKRRNPTVFQKSMAINDFYFSGPGYPFPLGNLQPVGKVRAPMLKSSVPRIPNLVLDQVASHSTDWWVMSEDLPDPENRVTLGPEGSIQVHWTPNNTVTHRKFIQVAKDVFRDAGYRVQIDRVMGIETNSHQVGTMRFGADPATSVLDPHGKAHDLDNLYVVDASFFPSSTAVNPALTIGAQAVRVADHLLQRLGGEAVHVPAR